MWNDGSIWVDIRDYAPAGLTRSGTADWTAYIQAAIDDAIERTYTHPPSAGTALDPSLATTATVYVPPGIYLIHAPLRILRKNPAPIGSCFSFVGIRILSAAPPYGGLERGSVLRFVEGTENAPGFVTHAGRSFKECISNLSCPSGC